MVLLGGVSLVISAITIKLVKLIKPVVLILYGGLSLAQIPPIILWVLFDGQPMPDKYHLLIL